MQVLEIDNVKIYNLSAGKSLPDWLTERKKRTLLKKNVDLRRRIELIQEFDMPGVSTSIRASKDGQYIMAAGIYKPRIKCFDVNNLSLKFERCLDSEVLTFEILSDDYTKIVFLQCDRYVEFHVGHGRHYRLRVPKFGREIAYHKPSCDLFVVGASSDIYRLNLEVGQFMAPYTTKAHEINCCSVNEEHGLLVVGTESGHVEAWDPRTKSRQGVLDCALHCTDSEYRNDGLPVITSIKFDGPLKMGVGTSTGHVLLYDLRSSKPLLVKDHMNGLPIKKLEFHKSMDYVYSMDSTVVKIWDKNTGKQYTSIESSVDFNDLCVIPNTGLSMMAVEDQKMQVYYIPSLGPAPRWCAFLDNLTEELESSAAQTVYDDYKFVTKQELESLGLDHLLGTNLLRAYMHGYFVDVRLYKRAKSIAEPFAFEEYKRRKIREKIEQERPSRIKVEDNLPKVNRELASRLMDDDGRKKKSAANLLKDNRFKAMFENPDFEVDKSAEEFRLLNPVLSRLDKDKSKSSKIEVAPVQEDDPDNDSDMELYQSSEEESSDDDRTWVKEVKKQHKIIRRKQQDEEEPELNEKVYEVSQVPRGGNIKSITRVNKASLGDRLANESFTMVTGTGGNREMKFTMRGKKSESENQKKMKKHYQERRQIVRRTGFLMKKKLPKM
ncbi:nucleolar protein 10 lethal (2) 34Fd [Choristoneura fumiferana]|uniref:nucleolar protein 10 lethal (2) 34Fd n=1 Tax=Choristoneura fumiferana TaxID=7141 RepID=UPI003D15A516